MRYLPYAAASSEPNVIVDGTANDRTLITLSHWRRSGTPADLMADTSTAIVFNYLDRPDLHVPADVVSNNHFDEDGLVGIYALLEPEAAASRRDLLIDVAQAGDFGVFRNRRAARIAFAISAHADPATSPFPRPLLFDRPAPQVEEGLYRALLDVLPRLLADVDHRVETPPLEGDLLGLDATLAPPRPVAGGEHGRQVRDPERPRLSSPPIGGGPPVAGEHPGRPLAGGSGLPGELRAEARRGDRHRGARGGAARVVQLGEVRREGHVIELAAVEPGVEPPPRPGVGAAGVRAYGGLD